MISTSDRQDAVQLIDEARVGGARLQAACVELGIGTNTYRRWALGDQDRRPAAERPVPGHALTPAERQRVFMRDFDDSCLTPVMPLSPEEIRALREHEHLSQPVFARYLNVSKNLVSDWERGVKRPGGPALRLLTLIAKNGIQAVA
jgi:putative transcriptional regulator